MKEAMREFIEYAKREFGYDIQLEKSSVPDTFETLFGKSLAAQRDEESFYKNTVAKVQKEEKLYSEKISIKKNIILAA